VEQALIGSCRLAILAKARLPRLAGGQNTVDRADLVLTEIDRRKDELLAPLTTAPM